MFTFFFKVHPVVNELISVEDIKSSHSIDCVLEIILKEMKF